MLEVSLTTGYIFLAIYLIGKWKIFRVPGISIKVFHLLFAIKIVAAIALYFIYTQFYTERAHADIFRYYDDSAVIYNTFLNNPGHFFRMLSGINADAPELKGYYDSMRNWYNTELIFNDSRTMIRLNAFLRLFSMGTYFPHAVVMCFLAMVGLTGIFRVLNEAIKDRAFLCMIIVYLLPSILLWTSGMIKEAFLVFALGTLLYQLAEMLKEPIFSWRRILNILIAVLILVTVKAYILFLIIPLILCWIISTSRSGNPWRVIVTVNSVYFFLLAITAPFITGKSIPVLIANKQAEFYSVAKSEQARSVVEVSRIQPHWQSLVEEAPGAFFRTLLLPMPGHAYNVLMWFSTAENLFILLLIIIMTTGIRLALFRKLSAFTISCFLFGCSVFVLSGLVTPIIGALVRYKVPGLPFLIFPLAAISYKAWMSGYFLSWFNEPLGEKP